MTPKQVAGLLPDQCHHCGDPLTAPALTKACKDNHQSNPKKVKPS